MKIKNINILERMKNNKSKGFTLIELIIVTLILGILASVAIPRYFGAVDKAEIAAENSVISALKAGVEAYSLEMFMEKGRFQYPENPFDLVDVDGYVGERSGTPDNVVSCINMTDNDGEWAITASVGTGWRTIVHRRNNNSVYGWSYYSGDANNEPSNDSGINVTDTIGVAVGLLTLDGDLSN